MGILRLSFTAVIAAGLGLASPAFAREGDGAGNGGGSAEKIFLKAHQQLPVLVAACLNSKYCITSGRSRTMLAKIDRGLKQSPPKPSQIIFRNADEPPFSEYSHKAPRSARTGDELGGFIYVNRDHLYVHRGHQRVPINLAEAAAWLVDEYAHQTGFPKNGDHSHIDHLCLDVERFLGRRVSTLREVSDLFSGVNREGITVTAYSGGIPSLYSDLIVTNPLVGSKSPHSGKIFSLGEEIRAQLKCPNSEHHTDGKWETNGFEIHNLHWDSLPSKTGISGDLMIQGFVNYGCEFRPHNYQGKGIHLHALGVLEMVFDYEYVDYPRRQKLVTNVQVSVMPLYRRVPDFWTHGRH